MKLGRALAGSFLAAIARPESWVLALGSFLIRGGIVLFVIPIWMVPTPVGLANVVAPTITSFVFGGISPTFVAFVAASVTAFIGWVVLAGLISARFERELILMFAADEEAVEVPVRPVGHPGAAWRVLAVRLIAYLPLVAAVAFASTRIVQVTYLELTDPSDVGVPVELRVLRRVPEAVINIVAAWSIGEIVGSLAARQVVLARRSVLRALLAAIAEVVRHPISTLVTYIVPTATLLVVTVPMAIVAGLAWDRLRVALGAARTEPIAAVGFVVVFVAVWSSAIVVAGALSAWRSAAWTTEVVRLQRTFGGSARRRAGDWEQQQTSGSL
ncbi:MAG: hypothetical protein ACJ761_02750 [Chloroflexota bacterium]